MIERVAGWIRRPKVLASLGGLLLGAALAGTLVRHVGRLHPVRCDLRLAFPDLDPGQGGPPISHFSRDGALLWFVYPATGGGHRILRCDRRTRTVSREDRSVAEIEAAAGTEFLSPTHCVVSGPARITASLGGMPYVGVVFEPNYFSPAPARFALQRTTGGWIHWDRVDPRGRTAIATQFVWGLPAGSERHRVCPDIASSSDGTVVSVWDPGARHLSLIFQDPDPGRGPQ